MKINKTMLLVALATIAIPISAMQNKVTTAIPISAMQNKVTTLSPIEAEKVTNVHQAIAELHEKIANSSTAKANAIYVMGGAKTNPSSNNNSKVNDSIIGVQKTHDAVTTAVAALKEVSSPKVLGTAAAKQAANLPLVHKAITEAKESQSSSKTVISAGQAASAGRAATKTT